MNIACLLTLYFTSLQYTAGSTIKLRNRRDLEQNFQHAVNREKLTEILYRQKRQIVYEDDDYENEETNSGGSRLQNTDKGYQRIVLNSNPAIASGPTHNSIPNRYLFDYPNNFNGNAQRIPTRRQNNFDNPNIFNNVQASGTQSPRNTTPAIPGRGTTRSPCEDRCKVTSQFDPVCGDNMVTYTNEQWLRCAQNCGIRVKILRRIACPRF